MLRRILCACRHLSSSALHANWRTRWRRVTRCVSFLRSQSNSNWLRTPFVCASLAPIGANQQPWKFVVVKDAEIKRQIREATEAEERESYEHRMPEDWL
jgi:nitroreductase